ncbi:MAG: MMPL family transporter [Spirochaetes bacterium]|nr:MMPL family transporter [Spirochaetota bacterium]
MKWLVRLSVNWPKVVIVTIVAITIFFAVMLGTNFSINVDPMKAFSRKMDVIKYYHLTLKKFSMKDMILIGVENDTEGIFNVPTLRYVERVIREFKNLKVEKTYNNIFTGKKETVEVPSKLSPDQIMSIINADDVMVDKVNNTIVIGNLTSRAREKAGLLDPDPEEMKKLPKSDEDLKKLIPFLKNELMGNDLLKGSLFSEDGKACAIMVPVEKRIDNKLEVIRREMTYMVNANKLKKRFKGRDFYFPHEIYQKTVDNTMVDDEFIKETVDDNRVKIRSFFLKLLKPFSKHYTDFYLSLQKGEVNDEYLNAVYRMIENDAAYEKPDVEFTYQDCIEDLYKFVIQKMDPFSRNNLESRLFNVADIYDVGKIYEIFNTITEKQKPQELKIYIAGMPVAEALLQEFIMSDLAIFMTLAAVMILVILFMTIRTPTGIYLPLTNVVISIVWLMGGMLMSGIDFSSGTMAMPCILIAVGSSYVIHYLIRYYEKIAGRGVGDVKTVLIETTDSIDTAIFLSAITTMAAFISDVFIDVVDIQRLGVMVTLGIAINMLLTFTYVPAVLALQPPPKGTTETAFERLIMSWVMRGGANTAKHSRKVFFGAVTVAAVFFVGLFFLKTESSISFMFLEKNPLRQADKFINKELTGTGQMCIVFKMRDRVNLASEAAREDLIARIGDFTAAFANFKNLHPELKNCRPINDFFITGLDELKKNPLKNQEEIENRVAIFTDIMNEYFESEQVRKNGGISGKLTETDDIGDLADDYVYVSGKSLTMSPREAGVENIISRIKSIDTARDKDAARHFIASLRNYKNTLPGKEFQGKFFYLSDFFHTDITQPATLRKIEALGRALKELKEPRAVIDGVTVRPVGNIMSITDTLKVIYKVFYHDDNNAYKKIPSVSEDGIQDKSLTDRSIIGVCMNQFAASREDIFRYLVTDDMKLMQYVVFMRSDKADFLREFQKTFNAMFNRIFPYDDPYVEKIVISGMPAINLMMNQAILINQIQSIVVTVIVVLLSCIFIFRSITGGFFVSIPISFTLIITLGVMGYFGIPINYSTLINASIAVGAGIDYCIHFIERFKYEHIIRKLDFADAYKRTLETTGLAIVTATLTVGLGFAVLGFSSFKIIKVSGLLVTLSMILSGTLSLTVLPALIIWVKPKFLQNVRPWGLEDKMEGITMRFTEKYKDFSFRDLLSRKKEC